MNLRKIIFILVVSGLAAALMAFNLWYRVPETLPPDNLLQNGGFERHDPFGWKFPEWSEYWKGFDICWLRPHTGWRSACLELHEDPEMSTAIWGVKQELHPPTFPHYIRGSFLVDRWEQGTIKMYLQVVLIAWFPKPRAGINNFQVRFLMGGVPQPPLRIENARYIVVLKDAPRLGEWVPFTLDLHQAFQEKWGYVPDEWSKLDVFFEARYDDRSEKDGPCRAKVYYDDLYVGDTPMNTPQGRAQ